ncbi:MAG: ATP-dependent DNA helicase RecG [Phycisphaeraceae bacterium]|nr:ATP-dependent DNA helicase RecG [Phycisphaeraceae bacterium]
MSGEAVTLVTPIEALPGVTERQAGFMRSLGVTNLGRLVAYLPMRHERVEGETPVREMKADTLATARGEITATRPVRRGRSPRFEAVLHDGTGRLDLVWFNQMFVGDRVAPGVFLRVEGKVRRRGPGLQMANPRWHVVDAAQARAPAEDARVRPVYPATADFSSRQIERVMAKCVPLGLALIDDHLPEAFRREKAMPELREAYRMQHAPADEHEVKESRRRLAYDELLMLQLGVHMKRAHLRTRLKAPALRWGEAIDAHIRQRLPFTLTPSQDKVVKEIAADLARPTPANRLIQGDVGSGKTVVALYAMLMAVASGCQGSIMAPTEILAEQHHASITRMLAGSRVRVELLTGGVARDQRESVLARLASGEIDILVGTHALLTEDVRFSNLAVAIIDEQHRFGVVQRASLRAKASDASTTPHVLVMTATPIPRTLAITLFGDLDVSVIGGLPPGRRPVMTRVMSSGERDVVYAEVLPLLEEGQQAYVVAPAIDTGAPEPMLIQEAPREPAGGAPRPPLRDCRTVAAELAATYLPGKRIGVMHGALSRAARETVMERFRRGEIDVLVATTVIEVGVDVPGATVMIIEQADRFGLSQLHQLRGRVGRGDKPSRCYLIADPTTDDAMARLHAVEATPDGFALAEKDLELRGPGEMFGARQSGLPPFKVADLMRDRELLAMARRDAAAWIERSPVLANPEEALLKRRMLKAYGEHLGLADVG